MAGRSSLIFGPTSPVLQAVSASLLLPDSKEFVDMPLKGDPEAILAQFEVLPREKDQVPDRASLQLFLQTNFDSAGSDMLKWQPEDLLSEPPFLSDLRRGNFVLDPAIEKWILFLHGLWADLARRPSAAVLQNPQRHTLIVRNHPLIVPGGRFREGYYWDSFWIVRGLIVSGALETACGVVRNMMDDVDTFGFVPNGGRTYYLNRSQPPLLSEMVMALARSQSRGVVNAAVQKLLADATAVLQKEHAWWMDPANGKSLMLERQGRSVRLNRYNANTDLARPESYREDEETVRGLGTEERARVLRELSSTAESGWDFSARWFREDANRTASTEQAEPGGAGEAGGQSEPAGAEACGGVRERQLRRLRTTDMLPVDLNVFILRMEDNIASLLERDGMHDDATRYRRMAADRRGAINAWMWSPQRSCWRDLVATHTSSTETVVTDFEQRDGEWASASDYFPLWGGATEGWEQDQVGAVVASLRRSGLVLPGGVQTTSRPGSAEQWDGPNAWPPVQSILVDGLRAAAHPDGDALADSLVERWLASNLAGWEKTGFMFEKYDAREPGKGGGGGEYTPQVGFGWTNGVALEMLQTTPSFLTGAGQAGGGGSS